LLSVYVQFFRAEHGKTAHQRAESASNVGDHVSHNYTTYAVGVFLPSAERSFIFVGMRFFRAERGKTAYRR
jgi:hypothetical protein